MIQESVADEVPHRITMRVDNHMNMDIYNESNHESI